MKVILLQDIEGLGKKFEVKDVSAGHARNFLLPNKLVKAATKDALSWLAEQKEIIEKVAEEDLKKTQGVASGLDGSEVNITVKIGEDGQLFESINTQKIAERLKEMGFGVKKSQIKLENPIKEVGEFPISISLDHNLEVEIKLIVMGQKQENSKEDSEE